MTLPLPLLPLGTSCFVAKSVVVRGGACLLRRGGGGTGTGTAAAAATASFAAAYCSNYSRRRRPRSHPRWQPLSPIEVGPVYPLPRSDPTSKYSQNGGGNSNNSNSTQRRSYSSSRGSGSGSKHNNTTNNFRILGLPSNASFKEVQQAFLTLALQYHPDTTTTSGSAEGGTDANANGDVENQMKNKSKTREENEHFIQIRQAYEQLRLDHKIHEKIYGKQDDHNNETEDTDTDTDTGQDDRISSYSEPHFLHWFYEQTGLLFTSEQRREMITLYRNRVGNYDGPAWDITRRLVEYQEMYLTRMYQQQQQQQGNTRNSDRDDEHAKKTYTTKRSATKNTTTNSTPIRRRRQR